MVELPKAFLECWPDCKMIFYKVGKNENVANGFTKMLKGKESLELSSSVVQ